MPVATLQIKQLPDELHAALRERAQREGTTLSELVTRMLRRELALPSMTEWLAHLQARPSHGSDIDVAGLMGEVREDRDPTQR